MTAVHCVTTQIPCPSPSKLTANALEVNGKHKNSSSERRSIQNACKEDGIISGRKCYTAEHLLITCNMN